MDFKILNGLGLHNYECTALSIFNVEVTTKPGRKLLILKFNAWHVSNQLNIFVFIVYLTYYIPTLSVGLYNDYINNYNFCF